MKRIILIFISSLVIYLGFVSLSSEFINNNRKHSRTNFLIIGTDFVDNAVHADTILIVSYSPLSKNLDIVSLPRDTYLEVEQFKNKKATEIYAYFFKKHKNRLKAAQEFSYVLSDNLFNINDKKLKLPYVVVLNYENFIKLFKMIGKVKIYVNSPMHYDDNAGNLHIHFDPGTYDMDAEDLLRYVRFRDDKGDLGRISRQQQLVKNLINKLRDPFRLIKVLSILFNLKDFMSTNLNFWEIVNLMTELRNIKLKDIRFSYAQGISYGRYWKSSEEYLGGLVDYLNSDVGNLNFKNSKKLIKVYNATNVQKLAQKVTEFLRNKGYDVLDWGNWYCELPKSRIIDYSGDNKFINEIIKLLSITDISTFYNTLDPAGDKVDLILVLGKDFDSSLLGLDNFNLMEKNLWR